MSNEFQSSGRALLGNGYLIIPIKPGHKRPALDQWQTARLGAGDLGKYAGCGVGVLCGQGAHPIAAIDVDTHDAQLAQCFVDWCRDNLGLTCERVGNAPKVLLTYRAASEGWAKATGAWFEDLAGDRHRLEVLGKGQQFVAYHVHPDTGRPYEWVDLLGGIEAVRADELPVISEAQVAAALEAFDAMAREAGLSRMVGSASRVGASTAPDADPLMSYEPPVGLTLDEVKKLLAYVDNEDYDTWLKAGMSLHHEFEGGVEALDLWDEWSSTAANYTGRESLEVRWEGFGRSGHRPTTARWLLKIGNANKREAVRSEKRDALQEARDLIAGCQDSIDLLGEVAHRVGAAAGDDLAIRAELTGLLRERFKALTDTPLPIADARAAMAGGRKAAVRAANRKRERTEFGNAERMLDHYGDGLMYVPELDAWFNWTGASWRRAAMVELEHLAKETIRAMVDEGKAIESDEEREAFYKFCAVSQRAAMVANMVKLAQSDPRVVESVAELDKHVHLLGVANGAVDLRTGKLLPPDPAYRITTITDVEFDPAARAPLFEQTVGDVFFDDADMVAFFQRLVGYSLLGKPDEDVLVIPYGSGSNGKSTVLGAIRETLGSHAKMASSETFLSSGPSGASAGQAREDVLRLRGARFVYVSEPDEGSELREGLIKSMTGGESMPARGLYSKATIEVVPTWVAIMPTNHRPIVKGDDHAIWRRLLPVPFTRNFDKDLAVTRDPDRAAKLASEAAGILAWCVRGALEYQKHGLKPPTSVRAAREDYRSDMDLLAEWLDECCEVNPEWTDTNARLWASWEAFAKSRGLISFVRTSTSLTRRIQSRGFVAIKHAERNARGFAGLRVKHADL